MIDTRNLKIKDLETKIKELNESINDKFTSEHEKLRNKKLNKEIDKLEK